MTIFGHKLNIRIILIAMIIIGSGVVITVLFFPWRNKTECRPQDNGPEDDNFEVEMCKLYPPNAIDCGEGMFGGSLMHVIPTTIDACVLNAFQKKQPVVFHLTAIRMDRVDYTGLVSTSNGKVTIIQYTWAIGNQVDVKVGEQHCPSNKVVVDAGDIVCKP